MEIKLSGEIDEWMTVLKRANNYKHLVATAKGIEFFICKCKSNFFFNTGVLPYEVHIVLFCSLYSLISLKFKIENNN